MSGKKTSITIVGTGISVNDISQQAFLAIENADIIIGGRRQLAFYQHHKAEKIEIRKDFSIHIKELRKKLKEKKTVVLASGDPNFFGIATLFYSNFDTLDISVLPNITAFQGAFARIKEPWNDAKFITIHGRKINELDQIVISNGTFIVYCDNNNSPSIAARYLINKNKALGNCRTWIFDSLGKHDEKVLSGPLKHFQNISSSSLVMMIIKNDNASERSFPGIPDSEFYHERGMITKMDVRLLSLSRLNLRAKTILWDVGAGSGSISIEAANLCPGLCIYAVEKQQTRMIALKKNIQKFKLPGINAVHGTAPAALEGLPLPDSVFIGGGGRGLEDILKFIKRKIKRGGHVVVNSVTADTISCATRLFKRWRWKYDITEVQISRLSTGKNPEIFRAENPVFIIQGVKP